MREWGEGNEEESVKKYEENVPGTFGHRIAELVVKMITYVGVGHKL